MLASGALQQLAAASLTLPISLLPLTYFAPAILASLCFPGYAKLHPLDSYSTAPWAFLLG